MFIHPEFDPVAIRIGSFGIHWYGLMYLMAFGQFLLLGRLRITKSQCQHLQWQFKDIEDLLFWGVLGVILGGRLGYVIFYMPSFYFANPLSIFKIWEGGMSFHGGLVGVIFALYGFARMRQMRFLVVTDFVAPLVPFGLAFGRLGNFINGELWGRPTDFSWGVIFPYVDQLPRHPSQLYQFFGEGLCLGLLLWIFSNKARPVGQVSGAFLVGYSVFRFLAEFAREPDSFLGLLGLGLTMGQYLSIPMFFLGIYLIIRK
ncbi:MAG: prolipoprotein diacylglyceryl transferase [Polynucleobacter sp.]|jgi:phosphatidylglycerol:prolipoprotein diacylglycerol transferase|nr:prolipoprotein diacylglyceryl transferase [Polynucleobacter sp.]